MKNDRKTKNELIEELESVRRKVKRLERLLKKPRHCEQYITERKSKEEALKESEIRNRNFIESAIDIIYTFSPDGIITSLNPSFETITGWEIKDWIGKSFTDLIHPEELSLAMKLIQESIDGKERPRNEFRLLKKTGDYVILDFNAKPLLKDGKLIGFFGIARDITEQKKMDAVLKEGEEKFENIFKNDAIGKSITMLDGTMIINPAFCQMLGYTMEELTHEKWQNITHPDDIELSENQLKQLRSGEKKSVRFIKRYLKKDGSIIWVDTIVVLQKDRGGKPLYYITSIMDITERKRAEEEKIKLLRVLEASLNEIYIFDISTFKFSYVNAAALHNIGCTFEEIKELTPLDLNPEFTENTFREKVAPLLRGENVVLVFQTVHRRKNRSTYPIEVHLQMVHSGVEKVFLAMIYDITERKQAEEALRLEKENFHRSLDESPLGVRIVTVDGDTLYANPAILDFYGYDSLEELRETPLKARYTPESYAEFQKRKQQRERGDFSTSEYVISIVRKNGEVLHLQVHRKEVLWNNAQQFLVIYQDITERKKMEEEVTLLAHTIRSISECVSVTDTENKILFVNDTFLRTYGYAADELIGKTIDVVRSPTTEPVTDEVLSATLQGGWQGELVNRMKDGTDFPISLSTSIVRNEKGQPLGLVGIAIDITESKRAEEELRNSQEELRMLANHLQNIREEERNHLAREFHDQIGQSMTALKMDLSLLLRMISDEKQDVQRKLIAEELQSMQKLVDETSQLLWAIITELRPQMLDDLGLVPTFEWEAKRFESRTGITCEFKSSEKEILLDLKKSIALFRIYQEVLTNITHHAKATVVKSVLRRDNEVLVLEVKDNGRGITLDEQLKPNSFGIISMRERALAIGGLLEITGIAGEGTAIVVRLPLEQVDTQENTGK